MSFFIQEEQGKQAELSLIICGQSDNLWSHQTFQECQKKMYKSGGEDGVPFMAEEHHQMSCFPQSNWRFYFHALKTILGKGRSTAKCHKREAAIKISLSTKKLNVSSVVAVERLLGICTAEIRLDMQQAHQ